MKTATESSYQQFLGAPLSKHWNRIGLQRRSGVATPLFSVYSKDSVGIGELPDLKQLVDWCESAGLSIIQLLPMNDVGFSFRPYDAESTFALEPMYLSLGSIRGVPKGVFRRAIARLKKEFAPVGGRVHYGIKAGKLDVLWQMFQTRDNSQSASFEEYVDRNRFWLADYALYRLLKEIYDGKSWDEWPEPYRLRFPEVLEQLHRENRERLLFYQWLQWQLWLQFKSARDYAAENGVLIMGDLPFLVSRDSADVWAHPAYFKLDLFAGAPPDAFFANGQVWGMPPYDWERIAVDHYSYLVEKLRAAEEFYDLFRIDHFAGVFRVWTVPAVECQKAGVFSGAYDPSDEGQWEDHGRRLVSVMAENSRMLPCAEDLGTIPLCTYKVLSDFGIPGTEIQRWSRDWNRTYDFKPVEEYRPNSVAMISTHDMSPLLVWWEFEAGTVQGEVFRAKCVSRGLSFDDLKDRLFDLAHSRQGRLRWRRDIESTDVFLQILGLKEEEAKDFVGLYKESYGEREKFLGVLNLDERAARKPEVFARRVIEYLGKAASIFSIQLLQDWLSLDADFQGADWDHRINFPGTSDDRNWRLVMPLSLEELKSLRVNKVIREINHAGQRI